MLSNNCSVSSAATSDSSRRAPINCRTSATASPVRRSSSFPRCNTWALSASVALRSAWAAATAEGDALASASAMRASTRNNLFSTIKSSMSAPSSASIALDAVFNITPTPGKLEQARSAPAMASGNISPASSKRVRASSVAFELEAEKASTSSAFFKAFACESFATSFRADASINWSFALASKRLNFLKSSLFALSLLAAFACADADKDILSVICSKDSFVASDCCSWAFLPSVSRRSFSSADTSLAFICATCSFCSRLWVESFIPPPDLNNIEKLLNPTAGPASNQPFSDPSSLARSEATLS
mmetsp:Transcript_93725/g.303488  ORF Transcript_93725/g.303488 Transcript_93725/m.303488 type:complete len:303 (+) Transcript_93725:570-1478(+)